MPSKKAARGYTDEPPKYTIDLSLPPAERYVKVAQDYKDLLRSLTGIFDELVKDILPRLPVSLISFGARIFLRKEFSNEQTDELRGISEAVGLDMFLLVAFNSLLDLFMGCSSGGVRVAQERDKRSKMLHFRTLDWDMKQLRQIVVQLEFIRGAESGVIARSVTYVGYVGVLTGVRPGLSIALNFRPTHESNSYLDGIRFHGHQLLVLLGLRPSISSLLRDILFSDSTMQIDKDNSGGQILSPSETSSSFKSPQNLSQLSIIPTTSAYLIFSNGQKTTVVEKDRISAIIHTSNSFISATNHDAANEDEPEIVKQQALAEVLGEGMQSLVDESIERKQCMVKKWKRYCERYKRKNPEVDIADMAVDKAKVAEWMSDWPITNECTHYAVVMDPTGGKVAWCRRWPEPAESPPEFS